MSITVFTKKDKKYENPIQQVLDGLVFAVIYDSYDRGIKVISPYGWTISSSFQVGQLRDSLGEVRSIGDVYGYIPQIEFSNWLEYDINELKHQLQKAEDDLEYYSRKMREYDSEIIELKNVLGWVYDKNEDGGPGSRRVVRKALIDAGVKPCPDCGHANCICED